MLSLLEGVETFVAERAEPVAQATNSKSASRDDECSCFQCGGIFKQSVIRSHVAQHILRAQLDLHEPNLQIPVSLSHPH